jgi:hypothetical protein
MTGRLVHGEFRSCQTAIRMHFRRFETQCAQTTVVVVAHSIRPAFDPKTAFRPQHPAQQPLPNPILNTSPRMVPLPTPRKVYFQKKRYPARGQFSPKTAPNPILTRSPKKDTTRIGCPPTTTFGSSLVAEEDRLGEPNVDFGCLATKNDVKFH